MSERLIWMTLLCTMASGCRGSDVGVASGAVQSGSPSDVEAARVVLSDGPGGCPVAFVSARSALTTDACVGGNARIALAGGRTVDVVARVDSEVVYRTPGPSAGNEFRLTVIETAEDVSAAPLRVASTAPARSDAVRVVGVVAGGPGPTEGSGMITDVDPVDAEGAFIVDAADPVSFESGDGLVLNDAGDLAGFVLFIVSPDGTGSNFTRAFAVDLTDHLAFIEGALAGPVPPITADADTSEPDSGSGEVDAGVGGASSGGCAASPGAPKAWLALALGIAALALRRRRDCFSRSTGVQSRR